MHDKAVNESENSSRARSWAANKLLIKLTNLTPFITPIQGACRLENMGDTQRQHHVQKHLPTWLLAACKVQMQTGHVAGTAYAANKLPAGTWAVIVAAPCRACRQCS